MRSPVLLALALLLLPDLAAADPFGKLRKTIRFDSSYKVRMQAIRVLSKRVVRSKKKPSDEVIEVLAKTALEDEEHLVRGMACFAIGKIGDPRGQEALTAALRDDNAFVRAQAEEALAKIRAKQPKPKGKRVLVVGTDVVPGVQTPPELTASLKEMLQSGFSRSAAGLFVVGDQSGTGFHMKGSIAELSSTTEGPATKVTVVVKIAIATWPDNNLRHVMSAKASARVKSPSGASLVRLQRKLLEAAVKKAIQDSMAQIGEG